MRPSKERQAQNAAREAQLRRLAYLFLLGLTAKLTFDGIAGFAVESEPEAEPIPEIMVFFEVEPKVPGTVVCLVDATRSQRVLPADKVHTLPLQGDVSWTVQAPGFRAQAGRFTVLEEDPADLRIPVRLESLVRKGVQRGRRRIAPTGRIRTSP